MEVKMKQSIVVFLMLLIGGCSGYQNPTTVNNTGKNFFKNIKSWEVIYDSTSGYNKPYGTLVDNELAFTPYKDVNSVFEVSSPEYMYSDLRGKKLSTIITKLLGEDGVKLSDNPDGVIVISRPTFLNEGRYILRTYIDLFDKDDKKLATIEVFNNLRKETTANGIRYMDIGDLMNDSRFAEYCTEKILSVFSESE